MLFSAVATMISPVSSLRTALCISRGKRWPARLAGDKLSRLSVANEKMASCATVRKFGFLLRVLAAGPAGGCVVFTCGSGGQGATLGAAAANRADLLGTTLGGGTGCKQGEFTRGAGNVGATGRKNMVTLWGCWWCRGDASRDFWVYRDRGIGGLVGSTGVCGSTDASCSGMAALDGSLFCSGTAAASDNILLSRDSSERGDSWR